MEQPIKFINTALPDIIELREVKQVYDDKPPIIDDFNLLIEDKPNQGQFVVLLGPSGSGKCVARGTWIVTDIGIRRIEDLFSNDDCIPDKVTSSINLNVKINENIETISHKYYAGIKKSIKIISDHGDYITGSYTHPVLIYRDGIEKWEELQNIKITDKLIKESNQGSFSNSGMNKEIICEYNINMEDIPYNIRMASFNHQLVFLQEIITVHSLLNNNTTILKSSKIADFVCNMLSCIGVNYKRYIKNNSNIIIFNKLNYLEQKHNNTDNGKSLTIRQYINISKIEYGESELYDLTNPLSHSFVANSFVVHNSTILRYISQLQTPTSGQVLIHGRERTKDDRIGMVFQQYSSFPWLSVLDNVALGLQYQNIPLKQRREKAMEMIKLVGLEGHENKYAQYPILSGGQLQRVAIARSLVYHSEILLMDEPFGALDIETRLQMQDLLAKIWVDINPTVVFVTHDISEAVYLGDDIYIMGKNPGNIRKMFRSPLPFLRNKGMKRSSEFIEAVNEVEDYMINIGEK